MFMHGALQVRRSVQRIDAVPGSHYIELPIPPKKEEKQWNSAGGTQGRSEQQICIEYNKFNGDCKFGKKCRYLHECSACKEHPISRNTGKESNQ